MSDNDTPLTKPKNKGKKIELEHDISSDESTIIEKKPKKKMTQKQLDNLKIGREMQTDKKKQRLIEAAKFLIENNVPLNSVKKSRLTREKFLKQNQELEEKTKIKKNKVEIEESESEESEPEKIIVKKIKKKTEKKPKIIEIEESTESEDDDYQETKRNNKSKQNFKSQENTRSKIKITKQPFVGGFI